MARLPSTISLMRRGGTLTALASAVCDRPIGFRNSSSRISPGCGFGSRSVIVDDLDVVGMALSPNEADPPLVVDTDRMLSAAISLQCLQAIGRRNAQIVQAPGIVEQTQLAQRHGLDVSGQTPTAAPLPDRLCLPVAKARDHCLIKR